MFQGNKNHLIISKFVQILKADYQYSQKLVTSFVALVTIKPTKSSQGLT